MKRERALKVVLVLLGLLFCAGVYPLVLRAKEEPALAMMMSLYVTLGILLLLAARNPSGESEPHRLHGVVELRSCRSHGRAGIITLDRPQGTDRVCCARCYRSSPDRVGSGKAVQ